MAKSKEEYLDEKIKLIYEFNTQSPLFTRIAKAEIENNNLTNALTILENGIKIYPNHPTGYFILGELLIKLDDTSKAKEAFIKGSELIHNPETLNYYIKKFFTNRPTGGVLNSIQRPEHSTRSIDDNLDVLAQKLIKAKLPKPTESDPTLLPEEEKEFQVTLFSETYADILASQGENEAAIEIYEKLIEEQPFKAESLRNKIERLSDSMYL